MIVPASWSWVRKALTPIDTWQYYYSSEEHAAELLGASVLVHRTESTPYWTNGELTLVEFETSESKTFSNGKIIACFTTPRFEDVCTGLFIIEGTFLRRGKFHIALTLGAMPIDLNARKMPSFKQRLKIMNAFYDAYTNEEVRERIEDRVHTYNKLDDARVDLATAKKMISEARKREKEIISDIGLKTSRRFGFDNKRPGDLYILRSNDGNYIKIGIAQDASRRHKQLSKTTPWEFTVVHIVHGSGEDVKAAESRAHKILANDNAGLKAKVFDGATEWFRATPSVQAYVDKLIKNGLDTD